MTEEEKDAAAAMIKLHDNVHDLVMEAINAALNGASNTQADRNFRSYLDSAIHNSVEPLFRDRGVGGR